jgi:hypothetical protein
MTPSELVLAQFPGRIFITLVEAGAALGLARQTTYNLRSLSKFPLRVQGVGLKDTKPMVALTDLVSYLETPKERPAIETPMTSAPAPAAEPVKRRRGRPTKREEIERRNQALR